MGAAGEKREPSLALQVAVAYGYALERFCYLLALGFGNGQEWPVLVHKNRIGKK
jgi:hypothetical protein